MPTLAGGYRLKDGSKVPSVTTILSRFKDSGALIHWAWKCGVDGKDYRNVKGDAATSGTLAHDMIERFLRGDPHPPHDPVVPEELRHEAELAFSGFRDWYDSNGIVINACEVPLVSEAFGFGGTLDAKEHGPVILDWKTSKRIYSDAWMQVGAYRVLWNENHPDDPVQQGRIVRFDKETGKWEERKLSEEDMKVATAAFLDLLWSFKSVKELERRAK